MPEVRENSLDTPTITSPIKAIRAKCLDCSGDSAHEVKLCTVENCPLYPFRFGKNPFHSRARVSEEQAKLMGVRQ